MKTAALTIASWLVACASTPPAKELQTVTPAGDGKFWAVGSWGLAVYYDGQRYHERDYPLDPEIDAELYDASVEVPVATVALAGGETLLFTRPGGVLRWSGARWDAVKIAWPREGASQPQIDRVFVARDDSIWVQIHSQVIVHGTLADFRAGRFDQRTTPSFFIELELIDDRFLAIGYAPDGNTMMGFEQRGTSFAPLGPLGRDGLNAERGVIALADGAPIAAIRAGFVPLRREARLDGLGEFIPVHPYGPKHTPYPHGSSEVENVFSEANGRALVTWFSTDPDSFDVVELRGDSAFAWACSPKVTSKAIGAFSLEGGWRIVEKERTIADLPSPRCRPAKKKTTPLIQAR